MRAGARMIMIVIHENILYQIYQIVMIYLIKCRKNESKKQVKLYTFFLKIIDEKSKFENWVFFRGGGKLFCILTFFYVQYEQTS